MESWQSSSVIRNNVATLCFVLFWQSTPFRIALLCGQMYEWKLIEEMKWNESQHWQQWKARNTEYSIDTGQIFSNSDRCFLFFSLAWSLIIPAVYFFGLKKNHFQQQQQPIDKTAESIMNFNNNNNNNNDHNSNEDVYCWLVGLIFHSGCIDDDQIDHFCSLKSEWNLSIFSLSSNSSDQFPNRFNCFANERKKRKKFFHSMIPIE